MIDDIISDSITESHKDMKNKIKNGLEVINSIVLVKDDNKRNCEKCIIKTKGIKDTLTCAFINKIFGTICGLGYHFSDTNENL